MERKLELVFSHARYWQWISPTSLQDVSILSERETVAFVLGFFGFCLFGCFLIVGFCLVFFFLFNADEKSINILDSHYQGTF